MLNIPRWWSSSQKMTNKHNSRIEQQGNARSDSYE